MFEPTATAGIYQDENGKLAIALSDEQLIALRGQRILRFARDGQAVATLDAQFGAELPPVLPLWAS